MQKRIPLYKWMVELNFAIFKRENNVKNAFQSSDNVVKYKRILIVDDIYTTGSTVEAVAERLKEAGAEQVYVLTACIGRGF